MFVKVFLFNVIQSFSGHSIYSLSPLLLIRIDNPSNYLLNKFQHAGYLDECQRRSNFETHEITPRVRPENSPERQENSQLLLFSLFETNDFLPFSFMMQSMEHAGCF